jgi:SAM-dependent methyltransferase
MRGVNHQGHEGRCRNYKGNTKEEDKYSIIMILGDTFVPLVSLVVQFYPGKDKVLRLLNRQRGFFRQAYRRGYMPWDTGISPPELVAVVEGEQALPPGRVLDLGCGTGTNSIYLAQHDWEAWGVDFTSQAIAQARRKARAAGVAVRFLHGDVTRLDKLPLPSPFTLFFDLGCFHGLDPDRRASYARGLMRLAAPGSRYLLYAFEPCCLNGHAVGLTPEEVAATFAGIFAVQQVVWGTGGPTGGRAAWYTLCAI